MAAVSKNRGLGSAIADEFTLPRVLWGVVILVGGLFIWADSSNVAWYVDRASGITAYLLLAFGTVFGILNNTRLVKHWMPQAETFDVHKFTAYLLLIAIGVHGYAILVDKFLHFTPTQILVPGLSPYRPLPVALGIFAGYIALALVVSFWIRQRIGHNTWRTLHYASYAAFFLGLAHGIYSGTDSPTGWMESLYVTTGALVLFATLYRVLSIGEPKPGSKRSASAEGTRHKKPVARVERGFGRERALD